MLIVVNFHYVRETHVAPYKGIHFVSPEFFRRQLSTLARDFDFVPPAALLRAADRKRHIPETSRACLITFDDGLLEQYEYALPILEEMHVPAAFFVCTQPVLKRKPLTVHKIHWLRSQLSPEEFMVRVASAGDADGRPGTVWQPSSIDDKRAGRQYIYDDQATRRLKYYLNHVLPYSVVRASVDRVFATMSDEAGFVKDLYMTQAQLKDIASKDGYAIESHSHSHKPLASLSRQELNFELIESRRTLSALAGKTVSMISYPYGGPTAVSSGVARAARAAGYSAGFTMERDVNPNFRRPLLLARLSTNDAPGGTSPLLEVNEEGVRVMSRVAGKGNTTQG